MIEQVAQAIFKGAEGVLTIETCRLIARTAIEAMREPTEAMVDEIDLNNSGWGPREHAKEVWKEVIDAALK